MTSSLKKEIATAVLEGGLDLEALEKRFPDVKRWDLRLARAAALKESRVEDVFSGEDTSLPLELKKGLPKSTVSILESGFLRPVRLEVESMPPPEPLFKKAGRQILIGSDFHAPDVDPHAMDLFIQIGRAVDADEIILNGDVFDCSSLSRYDQVHDRPLRWVEERELALPQIAPIRAAFPGKRIRLKLGNHDIRPQSWIDRKAKPLQGLFSIETLLGIEDLDFEIVEEPILLADEQLMVKHGTKISKHSGYSVKKEVEAAGLSIIMGHVHRRAVHEVTRSRHALKGELPLIGVESGCLCDLNPDYIEAEDTANWQQGFTLVTEYPNGYFEIELVRINYGHASFRGQLFRSRLLDE